MSDNLDFYVAFASEYSHYHHALDPAATVANWGRTLKDLGVEGKGLRLLDLGCGPGAHIAPWRSLGFTVEGLDGSAEMLSRARRRVTDDVGLYRADVRDVAALETLRGRYDIVVAHFNFLNLFAEREVTGVLENVATLLAREGLFATDVTQVRKGAAVTGPEQYDEGAWSIDGVAFDGQRLERYWRRGEVGYTETLYAHDLATFGNQFRAANLSLVASRPFQGNYGDVPEAGSAHLEHTLLVARRN